MGTVQLLWRREHPLPTRPGRRPTITVDAVVDAGIHEADVRGLHDISLRRIAERLGVGVMTLYGHVENKAQLLDLMVDQCRLDMEWQPLAGSWRARVEQVADENLALMARHPWLADVETERAVLGPGTLGKYERELAAVEPLPLDDAAKDQALALVLTFVRSSARALEAARAERREETPEQWWAREGAELAALGIEERFPLASRVGEAAGAATNAAADAHAAHVFGLAVLLDGLAAGLPRSGT
ncbi:TetR/AcrR family transcriptional regulator [Terrabacter sp. LjRoot27]|uniref:TetR/AcrR family transcriptional regulator n=1 Tax=Terrabacter sp. LjRoot27 TaxID=3342306 RepID=UPI003ED03C43